MKKFLLSISVFLIGLTSGTAFLNSLPIVVGATIPTSVALFETSLANSLTASGTSMTLVSATTKDGTTLSGTYAFIVDEGTNVEEFVIADCTLTACSNMTRGVSVISGTSSVTALKKAHRRGASVKITDAPQLLILSRILNGQETLPNILRYASTFTLTGDNLALATVAYVNNLSNQGAATSTYTNAGIVELATQTEMASGTTWGADEPHVISSQYATSTPTGESGSGLYAVISKANGKLHQSWLDLTETFTFSNLVTFTGGTTGIVDYIYGDGSDGDATIASGTTTLSGTKYYHNLTLSTGSELATAGYDIYVSGTLTQQGTGFLSCKGSNGTAGGNASGGTPGTAGVSGTSSIGTFPNIWQLQPNNGGTGGTAGNGGGSVTALSSIYSFGGSAGAKGGDGGCGKNDSTGACSGAGGTGGATSSITTIPQRPNLLSFAQNLFTSISATGTTYSTGYNNASGAGAGGGGSSNGTPDGAGGGGGGAGGNGCSVRVFAKNIVVSTSTLADVRAGNGGNGGNGGVENGGGGGGGAGGSGGFAIFVFMATSSNPITTVLSGGTGGSGGSGGGGTQGGVAGSAGNNGASGAAYFLDL